MPFTNDLNRSFYPMNNLLLQGAKTGAFNAAEMFWYPSPDLCHNPVSELYGQFLPPHGLVLALTCTVNCRTLYRQLCAFPNHAQSLDLTSRVINGNRMHLSSISSLIAKGLNTYINKVFLFFVFNKFAHIPTNMF